MADEAATNDSKATDSRAVLVPRRERLRLNRTLAMSLATVALCGVIALDIYFLRADDEHGTPLVATSAAGSSAPPNAAASVAQALGESVAPASPEEPLDYQSDEGAPSPSQSAEQTPKHYATVQQAAAQSCTTASVAGLSRQILAQARCLRPNAFVPLPSRPNLSVGSEVFPYLQAGAQSQLVKALAANPKQKMTINSALRTVAQQYLVWRWSAGRRCGVPLATPPGESNHELGTALDIAEASSWRPILEAHKFKWLGSSDPVHFDYTAATAQASVSMDVLAFQSLWNRNHPTDKIKEDGRYTQVVEQRLKRAPADGFSVGPSCGKPSASKR